VVAPKGEKLEKFFRNLAKDPDLYQRYLAHPKEVMLEEGLDEDVIDAVMGGELGILNDLLQGSNLICGTLVRI
jgi:hypothetical protein